MICVPPTNTVALTDLPPLSMCLQAAPGNRRAAGHAAGGDDFRAAAQEYGARFAAALDVLHSAARDGHAARYTAG